MKNKLIEQLKEDYKKAMVNKEITRKNIIQMIRANIQNHIRDNKITESTMKEEDILAIIGKELKQQKDSLEAFEQGNREDLANETKEKIEILETYLPEQMTIEEIEMLVKETMKELGIEKAQGKDRGKLMGVLMPKVKGKADGRLVNEIVTELSK